MAEPLSCKVSGTEVGLDAGASEANRGIDEGQAGSSLPVTGLELPMAKFFWESPLPAFAVDVNHVVILWNKACERLTGVAAEKVIGTSLHWEPFYPKKRPLLVDLMVDGSTLSTLQHFYDRRIRPSSLIEGCVEIEAFVPGIGDSGRWLFCTAAPLLNAEGDTVGAIEILQNITGQKVTEQELMMVCADLKQVTVKRPPALSPQTRQLEHQPVDRIFRESELQWRNTELTELNARLSAAQEQLVQSEKLASIGQLAAGVAHEINNPIGYIFSNFGMLETYIDNLLEVLKVYEEAEPFIASPAVLGSLKAVRDKVELDYIRQDMPLLLSESKEGIVRVRKIVQSLKDFSRADDYEEWQWADLHSGIDSTLNIVSNEVKYRADVKKQYGDIPHIECLPSQINQVVMNLLVNAAQATKNERGLITIRTGVAGDHVWIEVQDAGTGIPKAILPKIFDPFFTTKPVGSGTGLGLSLSYGIVQKHNGRIDVVSEMGIGTTFRVVLPISQRKPVGAAKE